MKIKTLNKLKAKLKEMTEAIKELEEKGKDIESYCIGCKYRAQVKRTSMDLTRLLADLRLDR